VVTNIDAPQNPLKAKHSTSAKRQERNLSIAETVRAQQQLILFIHYKVMAGSNNCTETNDHRR